MDEKKCPTCGKIYDSTFNFCKRCGVLLTNAPIPKEGSVPSQSAQMRTTGSMQKPTIQQMGSEKRTFLSFYDPFAGYGERGRFVSWLLNNLGDRAEMLRNAVTKRFSERQIPATEIKRTQLHGKGLLAETREYYMARRREISVGVYISRFGKDLYISMVTYYKGQISLSRTFLAIFMILFMFAVPLATLYTYNLWAVSVSNQSDTTQQYQDNYLNPLAGIQEELNDFQIKVQEFINNMLVFICFWGPFAFLDSILVLIGLGYSLLKGISELDALILLRTPPNEFQEDNIVALERAVEETVREAMDAVGIDSQIIPVSPTSGWHKRII